MTHCFLSYKRADRPRSQVVIDALRSDGIAIFWDLDIPGGERWRERIGERLDSASCVLVAWTTASVAPDAGTFVHDEAQRALARGVLLPFRLDDVAPPLGFGEIQSVDLAGWEGDREDPRWLHLLASIRAIQEGRPRPPQPRVRSKPGRHESTASSPRGSLRPGQNAHSTGASARAPQAFLSYRTRRTAEVEPLIDALAKAGVIVWRDEARIDEGASLTDEVISGLAGSQVLLAWYSVDYPASRICQWEQALAWVAAEAGGSPHQRVFLLLPPDVKDVDHVLGLTKEQKAWRVPATGSPEELATFARALAERIVLLDGRSLGELAPLAKPPPWLLRARMHPSERFTGRAKDLWSLHGYLHAERLVAVTGRGGPSTAQVRGLGGIGKTLLAVEYVERFGAAFPGGICWVDTAGRTPEGVLADLAIKLGQPPDAPEKVKNELSKRGPHLWVADNLSVGLTQAEFEAWCAPTPNGRTLVTTRSRTWEALGKALDLGVLAPDEALLLLTKRRAPNGEPDRAAAVELCNLVGCHPLTLDVLGALVKRHPGEAPYAAWLKRLQEPAGDALQLAQELKEQLPTGSARYVGAVLQASFEGLDPEAMDLLRLAVSLAQAPIPAELVLRVFREVEKGSRVTNPPRFLRRLFSRGAERTAEDRWIRGVDAGQARSLLEVEKEPARGYAVHALVRRVLAYNPREQKRIAALRAAAVAVVPTMFDGVEDIRNHGRIAPVVAHARRLEGELVTREETALPSNIAHFHHVRGTFSEAKVSWDRALEARTRLLGAEHPATLTTMQNLAVTLKAQGDLAGARSLEERALEARTRLLGAEHPATLNTMQNLAGTLQRIAATEPERAEDATSRGRALVRQFEERGALSNNWTSSERPSGSSQAPPDLLVNETEN